MASPKPLFRSSRAGLVLGSASPRRQRLLRELGLEFAVQPAAVTEALRAGENAEGFVRRLAADKARAVAATARPAEGWVLAADTVVVLDGRVLGKPEGPSQALAMLQALDNRWHQVWTGVCLAKIREEEREVITVRSEVRFAAWPEAVYAAYVRSGEPLDKAGGYGIQGRGGALVAELRGSYSNVVGLPLAETIALLLDRSLIVPA